MSLAGRRSALDRDILAPETEIGIYAHENVSFGRQLRRCGGERRVPLRRLLGRARRQRRDCPIEPFIAVADLMDYKHDCDLFELQDDADDIVRPPQNRPVRVDRETLTLGYAGEYSSFLRHAKVASQQYGVDVGDLLVECGKRRLGAVRRT